MSLKRFASRTVLVEGLTGSPDERESRHFAARRVKEGEIVEIVDPAGVAWQVEVVSARPWFFRVQKKVGELETSGLTIAVAPPQANRAAIMVEKCCEIGVAAFQPVICERSVVHPKEPDALVERWSRIAEAAAKQSGAKPPAIKRPALLGEFLAGDGRKLILAPGSRMWLCDLMTRERPASLTVIIGPEGGFTKSELVMAVEAGVASVQLGPTVLRTETAAIVAAALFRAGAPQ